jgi:hypothetical protein
MRIILEVPNFTKKFTEEQIFESASLVNIEKQIHALYIKRGADKSALINKSNCFSDSLA